MDDEPVAERPDRSEVLLDGQDGPRVRPDVGGDVERRDRPQQGTDNIRVLIHAKASA